MTRRSTIDQPRLIALRMQRGLAVRQLARDCGIEIAVLNRLETATDPSLSTISVAALTRIAERLNVPAAILFTEDTQSGTTPTAHAEPDPQRLGSLLNALGQDTAIVALADALEWTTDRVHAAAKVLDETLRPAGLTTYKNAGLLSIRPLDDSHSDAELTVRRHPRAKPNQRLVTPARARILFNAQDQQVSQHSLSASDRVNIATLLKAGLLVEGEQRSLHPAPDVLDSLNPPR